MNYKSFELINQMVFFLIPQFLFAMMNHNVVGELQCTLGFW